MKQEKAFDGSITVALNMRRKKRRLLSILVGLTLALGLMLGMSATVYADEDEETPGITFNVVGTLKKGINTKDAQTVRFGMPGYESDGNEKIAWRVIGYGGDDDGVANNEGCFTLVTSGIIANKQYHEGDIYWNGMPYSDTTLRQWVNSIPKVFSTEECAAIRTGWFADDFLWPLSYDEAERMDNDLRALGDDGSDPSENSWWLRERSSSADQNSEPYVKGNGEFADEGLDCDSSCGVRLAFHLDGSKVLFLSAVENGKDHGDLDGTLGDVKTNKCGEWKLTLSDETRADFDAELKEAGDAMSYVDVSYSGAVVGDDFISAILADKEGNAKKYGRIKHLTSDSDSSGTVRIILDNAYQPGDSLLLFNEKCFLDARSDCSSPLIRIPLGAESEEEPEDPDKPAPVNNWNEPVMEPGETFHCNKASWNTSVYITKPGDYTLAGKSSDVRVMIESTGVRLYLEDGLDLECGATSYVGSRTAAINIGLDNGEKTGNVEIISKNNAKVYLEGYMCPAIRKDDIKTKLVFETNDANQPGTIEAKGGTLSAGIGGVCYASSTPRSTGNMLFVSGNIIARGTRDIAMSCGSAGIGGSSYGGVKGITINGGYIEAYGALDGAAIGSGGGAPAEDIVINGGTIKAYPDYANEALYQATIGSGGGIFANDMTGLVINGGDITAISYDGPAIGAGGIRSTLTCDIKGGTIRATGTKSDYTSCGIGMLGPGDAEITIEGGVIYAAGYGEAPAIGMMNEDAFYAPKLHMSIRGGTVTAAGGNGSKYDIGRQFKQDGESIWVEITGGSVLANKVQNAQNADGKGLHMLEVGFENVDGDGLTVTDGIISGSGVDYSFSNMVTTNIGKVYLWLPSEKGHAILGMTVDGKQYSGNISIEESKGGLYLAGDSKPKKVSASIKAKPKTIKKRKGGTVKITSNSGARLTAKSSNSKAKKALKKKYVKIKKGKTAKITFTKKAPKGKYTFKVTSPAKGKFKKTVKIITIKVK